MMKIVIFIIAILILFTSLAFVTIFAFYFFKKLIIVKKLKRIETFSLEEIIKLIDDVVRKKLIIETRILTKYFLKYTSRNMNVQSLEEILNFSRRVFPGLEKNFIRKQILFYMETRIKNGIYSEMNKEEILRELSVLESIIPFDLDSFLLISEIFKINKKILPEMKNRIFSRFPLGAEILRQTH